MQVVAGYGVAAMESNLNGVYLGSTHNKFSTPCYAKKTNSTCPNSKHLHRSGQKRAGKAETLWRAGRRNVPQLQAAQVAPLWYTLRAITRTSPTYIWVPSLCKHRKGPRPLPPGPLAAAG